MGTGDDDGDDEGWVATHASHAAKVVKDDDLEDMADVSDAVGKMGLSFTSIVFKLSPAWQHREHLGLPAKMMLAPDLLQHVPDSRQSVSALLISAPW